MVIYACFKPSRKAQKGGIMLPVHLRKTGKQIRKHWGQAKKDASVLVEYESTPRDGSGPCGGLGLKPS
jgi:hypothetical protein